MSDTTFNGGKMHAVIKHGDKKVAAWSPGDDEVHFPKGTRPTDEQLAIVAELLKDAEIRLKVHGRNCAFVMESSGSTRLYLRRQKPRKKGFDDLSDLEKSCLIDLPEGKNGGSGRYKYLSVPTDPVRYVLLFLHGSRDPDCVQDYTPEQYAEATKTAKQIFGNLDAIQTVYEILKKPHFQRYVDKGWITAELCGPAVMPHIFVPKTTSLAVHCEQPLAPVPIKSFDDIMRFFETWVCEGVVVRKDDKYYKCRADRLGFMYFERLCTKKPKTSEDLKKYLHQVLLDKKRVWEGVYHVNDE